jgi:hypothetical protein
MPEAPAVAGAEPAGPDAPRLGPVAMDVSSGSEPESELERVAEAAPKPRWFTPLRLLIVFCLANIMVYLDRGAGRPGGTVRAAAPSYGRR